MSALAFILIKIGLTEWLEKTKVEAKINDKSKRIHQIGNVFIVKRASLTLFGAVLCPYFLYGAWVLSLFRDIACTDLSKKTEKSKLFQQVLGVSASPNVTAAYSMP